MQLLKIIKGQFNLDRLRLSIKYHRRFFIFIFVAFFVGINARNIGEYYTTPWPSNRLRMEFDHRSSGENERSDDAVACSFTNAAESATNLQRTPAAAYTTRRDATRRDATQRDGTGPTTRSIETTRLDELAADQLLSRMLIIVLEAFGGELYVDRCRSVTNVRRRKIK